MADYQLTQAGASVQSLLNKIGTAPLNTTATMLSNAINELDGDIATNTSDISANASAIGTLSDLDTTDQDSLVGAINEVIANKAVLENEADSVGVCYIGDLLIQWGTVSITPVANTPTTAEVTFSRAYAYNPFVGVVIRSGEAGRSVTGAGCSGTNTTGTTVVLTRTTTTNTTIGWVAIGKKASANSLNSINPINLNPLNPTVVNEEEM